MYQTIEKYVSKGLLTKTIEKYVSKELLIKTIEKYVFYRGFTL